MGWSQPGGGCGDVHRTTVLSGALERHQLASAPPSRRCWMAVLPIPPPSRTSAMGEAKWGGMRMRNRRADATAATKSYSCTSLRPSALVRRSRDRDVGIEQDVGIERASNDEDEDDAMGRRCRDLPPRARGTRHGADATSAMACDPSSAGASRPTISSFPMCRSSPPPSCPPPTGVGA